MPKEKPMKSVQETKTSSKIVDTIATWAKNPYNASFLVILVLGFWLRLKYIWQESMWNDAAVHLWFSIKVTRVPSFFFHQDYLMGDYQIPQTITALIYIFTQNAFLSAKITALLYFIIGCVLIYLLGQKLHSKLAGVIATALYASNHLVWFYSSRILGDSPLLVATMFMLLMLVIFEQKKTMKWGLILGFSMLVPVLHKVQAIVFILGLLIYYILFKRTKMFTDKPTLVSWLIPGGGALAAHVLAKYIFKTKGLDRVFGYLFQQQGMPYGFESIGQVQWIMQWWGIGLLLMGILLVLLYKRKQFYGPIMVTLFYLFYFETSIPTAEDRYLLPTFALTVILASFAIVEIAEYAKYFGSSFLKSKKTRVIVGNVIKFLLIFCVIGWVGWQHLQIGDPLIYSKSFSYTGHQEAGQWLKANSPPDAPIMTGSYRFTRLWVESDEGNYFKDEGGRIWNLRARDYFQTNQTNFEYWVDKLAEDNDVFLYVDIWEYEQPKYYYPLSQQSFEYFATLGFELVHVTEVEVNTQQGLQKRPAIFILRKPQKI